MAERAAAGVEEVAEATVGERRVDALAVSDGGDLVAAASSRLGGNLWDGELRLFTLRPSGTAGKEDLVHDCAVQLPGSLASVAWVTGARTLACGGDDGNIHVFSVEKVAGLPHTNELRIQNSLADHEDAVTALAMDALNHRLVSGSLDGTVKLWDPAAPQSPVQSLEAEVGPLARRGVRGVMCAAQSGWIASAHEDGGVRLWDRRVDATASGSAATVMVSSGGSGACMGISSAARGGLLACGMEDGSAALLDVRKPDAPVEIKPRQPRHGLPCCAVQLLADEAGSLLASAGDDGSVRVGRVGLEQAASKEAAVATVASAHAEYARVVVTRPKADLQILSGGWDGLIKLYNVVPEAVMRL